jgi:hypothetical protein
MNAQQLKEPAKASALFTSHELQKYKTFLYPTANTYLLADKSILLPTAEQYADFLAWDTQQRARRHGFIAPPGEKKVGGEAKAKKCGHALHPGHPFVLARPPQENEEGVEEGEVEIDGVDRCPMCVLEIHLTLLAELWDKWLDVGGPWRDLPPGVDSDSFIIAKRAYYQAKTESVNAMDAVEDVASSEATWSAANPDVDVSASKEHMATKAVEEYRQGIHFPARLADAPPQTPPPRKTKKVKKRLSYSPETPEETRHTPNSFYSRSMTSYDTNSPHACPYDEGWADSSFNKDWEYNVRQSRLLLCDREPSVPGVTYRELTHELSKDHLVRALQHWFSSMDPGWVLHCTRDMIATADIFLVWKAKKDEQWYEYGEHDCFDTWNKIPTLAGSNLEAYARSVGDVDIENFEALRVPPSAEEDDETKGEDEEDEEEDEADEFSNQESMAEEENSEEEDYEGIADPMDLEEDEEVVVDVAEQEGQPGHTVPEEDAGTEDHWLDKKSEW